MTCPCKGCKFRVCGCHAFCKNYLEYRIEVDKRKEERHKRIAVVNYVMAQRRAIEKQRNVPKGRKI